MFQTAHYFETDKKRRFRTVKKLGNATVHFG